MCCFIAHVHLVICRFALGSAVFRCGLVYCAFCVSTVLMRLRGVHSPLCYLILEFVECVVCESEQHQGLQLECEAYSTCRFGSFVVLNRGFFGSSDGLQILSRALSYLP